MIRLSPFEFAVLASMFVVGLLGLYDVPELVVYPLAIVVGVLVFFAAGAVWKFAA